MKLVIILLLSGILAGCSYSGALPNIPHHHWGRTEFGAELYSDSDGHESASFINNWTSPAQACDYDHPGTCHYFETNQQALNWLQSQYLEKP